MAAGQWAPGDPDITIVMDAGYDVTRLAGVVRDLPVEPVGRIRSDRVMRLPKPPRVYSPKGGHPPKHGPEFRFNKPETWPNRRSLRPPTLPTTARPKLSRGTGSTLG